MQHISSQQALAQATSRLLEVAARLDDTGLGAMAGDLGAVAGLLRHEPILRRTLSEVTTEAASRLALMAGLLRDKVGQPALDVVESAVSQHWANGQDLISGVERLARTATFLRAERIGELDDVEDQLFRFGRIVDGSPDLSVVLDDPTIAGEARGDLVRRLLDGRAHPLTEQLLTALAADPGGRSFSHGIRQLVEQAAARRDKVVAEVRSAVPLTTEQTNRVVAALARIYHRAVTAHVIVDPRLLGGISIRVGDEVIDGSVGGRLAELRSRLAG